MLDGKPQEMLFRASAMERLAAGDDLDQLVQVTRPLAWLQLAGLVLLTLAAFAWSIWGSVPTKIACQGILLAQSGLVLVETPARGTVESLDVEPGQAVRKGQTVATIRPEPAAEGGTRAMPEGRAAPLSLPSPLDGHVLERLGAVGDVLERGRPLLLLEERGEHGRTLEAVAFVPARQGLGIRPGMRVELSPSTLSKEKHGVLLGGVSRVGGYPATRETLTRLLKNEALVNALAGDEPVLTLHIALTPDPMAPSGYLWSSAPGPATTLRSGSLCKVRIVVRE